MISKNKGKKLPKLLLYVDILSTIPVLLFTLSVYYFVEFCYVNFDMVNSFSKLTSTQYQELAFSLFLFLCGLVVIPFGVAVYRVANDRTTFFSEQPFHNDGGKRYKPFVILGITILITFLALLVVTYTNEKSEPVLEGFLLILYTADILSFLGIEWYRRKLAE